MSRIVYTVITPTRVFVFGSWKAAQTFHRRARRLPSMRGQEIEFVSAKVIRGARRFTVPIPGESVAACGCPGHSGETPLETA
jgi:hypothetical protein